MKGTVMLNPEVTDKELIEFINNHPDYALLIDARTEYAPFTIAGQVVDQFVHNEWCEVVVTLKGRGPTQIEALRRALTGKRPE